MAVVRHPEPRRGPGPEARRSDGTRGGGIALATLVSELLDLLSDPRVGIPVLLLLLAFVLWVAGRPSREPVRRRSEPAERAPDGDPVSRTYVALRNGAYSEVLDTTFERLDRAVDAKSHCHLRTIPWTDGSARRLGLPDPKGLRQSRDALNSLIVWAVALETGSPLRWDFWRTQESSRARFQARLSERLSVVDRQLTSLGFTP
ncbi:MAG: hypothetical protein L3K16_01155 [Thermoplasmata archaeon]|nr:hypothetical protein [Thermoplasmata archaeon]